MSSCFNKRRIEQEKLPSHNPTVQEPTNRLQEDYRPAMPFVNAATRQQRKARVTRPHKPMPQMSAPSRGTALVSRLKVYAETEEWLINPGATSAPPMQSLGRYLRPATRPRLKAEQPHLNTDRFGCHGYNVIGPPTGHSSWLGQPAVLCIRLGVCIVRCSGVGVERWKKSLPGLTCYPPLATGTVNENVLPLSNSLWILIWPPCISTRFLAMEKPSPCPGTSRTR